MDDVTELTPLDRIGLFKSVVAEQRYTQNAWSREEGGKQYLCLAAAWGKPGEINGTEDCPVTLFPKWLFELMPQIDDGVSEEDVPWLFEGFATRAEGMAKLSPEAWDRIQTGFMIATVKQAVEAGRPVQPTPVPEYWGQVETACDAVIAALQGNGDLKAAEAAAWAAEAAARAAAWAAARAAHRKLAEALFALIDAEINGTSLA